MVNRFSAFVRINMGSMYLAVFQCNTRMIVVRSKTTTLVTVISQLTFQVNKLFRILTTKTNSEVLILSP